MQDFIRIIETWQLQRTEVFKRQAFNEGSNAASLRQFVEIQNNLSRKLITLFEKQDPEFFSALGELAMNAERITTGNKIFVNGQDRTQEGM